MFNCNNGSHAAACIWSCKFCRILQNAKLFCIAVYFLREFCLKTSQMCSAVCIINIVAVAKKLLFKQIHKLECNCYLYSITHSCIGDNIMNCFLALIQLADISRNSIWLIIGNALLLTASLVIKDNFQTWI